MIISWTKTLTVILAIAVSAAALCQGPGDLVITPTRVHLNDKNRSSDITLVNRGSKTMRYRLKLVDMEMSENGVLRRSESAENSAASILRLSPREIVLEPGVSQRIKIAAMFPSGTQDREFRSHISFEPIAEPKLPAQPSLEPPALKLSFEVRSVVTIPVIAQHGSLAATASISQAELAKDPQGWIAKFKLVRSGTRTIRGEVTVSFVPAGGGPRIALGHFASLPVYYPNADRLITVRLSRDIRSLGKGDVEISFAEPERSRGAAAAKMVVVLPT